MAESRRRHRWQYRPGEMVVAVELPDDPASHGGAHQAVLRGIEQQLSGKAAGVFAAHQTRNAPLVLHARGRPPLGFLFYDLAVSDSHEFVKQVVTETLANDLAALDGARSAGVTPVGVMPHWLGSPQQSYNDGSPATPPRPARPPRGRGPWRHRYTPRDRELDFRGRIERRRGVGRSVPVLILDTPPVWKRAQAQAARFSESNGQLQELMKFLPDTPWPAWHATALAQRDREGLRLAPTPDGRARGHDVSDHALFIAGLIHDLSPKAELHVRPVLNRYGVGDLHLLLQVLEEVLRLKPEADPLIVNMSLGFLPKLEHLHWLWFGVDPPADPDFIRDVPIEGTRYDANWLASNRQEVERTSRLLHSGVARMAEYLLANNCLAVAAAGNDSLRRFETGRARFGPRIPARYETVLGVAATTRDPLTAAPYSNMGDDLEYGDHIATFGGGATPDDEPRNGVISVYSAPTFPSVGNNENGWATWSGTSFATAIASGLLSGYWTLERVRRPELRAEQVLAEAQQLARAYAPALRTRSIAMNGDWERMPP